MAELGGLVFDVVEQEQPGFSNTITDKPVEDGVNVSDHIRSEPNTMNFKAIFSGDKAMSKYSQLLEMKESHSLYSYSGGLGTYTNLAIESVSPMKDANYGDGYECTITLKQVRIAEVQTVGVTLGKDPATGEQAQDDTTSEEIPEETTGEENVNEESVDRTSLQIIKDLITDKFTGGEEE